MKTEFGLCENQASRFYGRGVPASNEACEYFVVKGEMLRRCEECHDWHPLDTMPYLGECHNPASPRYRKAVFWDQISGSCFKERRLEGGDFAWCQTCHETISVSELGLHASHRVFTGSSQLPVEDLVEFTLAGE